MTPTPILLALPSSPRATTILLLDELNAIKRISYFKKNAGKIRKFNDVRRLQTSKQISTCGGRQLVHTMLPTFQHHM